MSVTTRGGFVSQEPEPYWRAGMPVRFDMGLDDTDLCDSCGVARWMHVPPNFCPGGGFASGYRRAVGPNIVDQYTTGGVAKAVRQPAPPMRGYRG